MYVSELIRQLAPAAQSTENPLASNATTRTDFDVDLGDDIDPNLTLTLKLTLNLTLENNLAEKYL